MNIRPLRLHHRGTPALTMRQTAPTSSGWQTAALGDDTNTVVLYSNIKDLRIPKSTGCTMCMAPVQSELMPQVLDEGSVDNRLTVPVMF